MNDMMNKIKLPLMASVLVAAFAAPAAALPASALAMDPGAVTADQNLKQDVRLVCRANGRCYEVRRRFYEEPDRYYRSYGGRDYDYYGGPSYGYGGPGIGFSFGFGGGHHRW